jgi:lipopolysaccharide export LptBFGC system permease protein LptF
MELTEWNETPWKVLSSSQNPEYLGIPGLTMYLNANRDLDDASLAPFRTNWWYAFAEPISCLAMILVAAPLGIVYSRRGVMGGVTGAICIFALMYVMRGTFLAMGHSGRMPPFLAASLTNFIVCGIGLFLLWKKSRNEEIPKPGVLLKRILGKVLSSRSAPAAKAVSHPVT